MKILFLNHEFPQLDGQQAEACYYLLREYSKNPEIEIDFVTTSDDGQYHLLQMGQQINIHRLPIGKSGESSFVQTRKNLLAFAKSAQNFSRDLAKQNKYDFVHAFSLFPCGLVAQKIGRKSRIPFVVTLRKSDVFAYDMKDGISSRMAAFKTRRALKKSLFLISGTQLLKDMMLGLESEKEIGIIRNGIETTEYFPDESKRNPEEFRILCVSQIMPMRGVRFLIQAFKTLSGRYPQVRLSIVGDGNERRSLEDLVQGIELKDKVEFVGTVAYEKVVEYYQKSTVFVRPTMEESKNRIVLEALASGLPVITTDTENVHEIIADKANGFFVSMKDSNDLVEKIESLIVSEQLLAAMSKNARRSAEQIGWDAIAGQYLKLYVETMNLGHIRQE